MKVSIIICLFIIVLLTIIKKKIQKEDLVGVYVLTHKGDIKYIDTLIVNEKLTFKHVYEYNKKNVSCLGTIEFYDNKQDYFDFVNFECMDSNRIIKKYFSDQPLKPYRVFPCLSIQMNLDSDNGLYYKKIE